MESIRQELLAAERAAAAPFVDQPRSEAWYPLLMAGFLTALAAGPVLTARGHGGIGFPLQALAIVLIGLYYARHRARAGAAPRTSRAPTEIRRAYGLLLLGALAAVLVSTAAWVGGGWAAGLPVVFASSLAVTWLYERRIYPRAVTLVRERLA